MAYNSDIHLNRIDDEVTSRLGAIKAIYRGTIAVDTSGGNPGTNTATITSVTTGRAVLTHLGTSSGVLVNTRLTLTNATTITATASSFTVSSGVLTNGLDSAVTVGYQVVEYDA